MTTLFEAIIWLSAATGGRRPRRGPLRDGAGAGRMEHSEWGALLSRFVQPDGVDYAGLARVQRLLREYLQRLADTDPDTFVDADDQLALYLNAFNAIVAYEITRHYPVATIRDVPGALLRPYAVGRRNLSPITLHASVIRAFGDPRVHAALHWGAHWSPPLDPQPWRGATLQADLDRAMQRWLADPQRGTRYDSASGTLYLSPLLRWFGGDFVRPAAMPGLGGLGRSLYRPGAIFAALRPYLPPPIASLDPTLATIRWLDPDWTLNQRATITTGRTITTHP